MIPNETLAFNNLSEVLWRTLTLYTPGGYY